MARLLQDILPREAPMPPSEVADLIQRLQVQRGARSSLQGILFKRQLSRCGSDVG